MNLLFQPQNILFTTQYDFGGTSDYKDKISIILKIDDEKMLIVQALTTSQ
ncbi:MAG: hypothetical protein ACI85I_000132 [Arenicella sp.]|jgi:hypothetical protein